MLQEALVPAYSRPWDGADGFEALCERLAERCGGRLPEKPADLTPEGEMAYETLLHAA